MSASLDKATEAYLKLREKKSQIQQRHKEELKPINEKMERIENAILAHFQKTGQQSAKTAHGTPYIKNREHASVADREAFMGFVLEGGHLQFLENKANISAVREFIAEHDEPPPGVKFTSEPKVYVRS